MNLPQITNIFVLKRYLDVKKLVKPQVKSFGLFCFGRKVFGAGKSAEKI